MMFDYILLFIAVFCFVGQFLFIKLYEQSVKQSLITSITLFIISSVVNLIICLIIGGFKIEISAFSLFMSVIVAVVFLLCQVIGIKILSLGNIGIYSMFMMLGGMALPVVYGVIFLKETLSIAKMLGLILLTFAVVFQVIGQKTDKKNKTLFYILCFVIFILNGMSGVLSKIHQTNSNAVSSESYMILYNGLGIPLALIIMLIGSKKKDSKELLLTSLKLKPLIISVICAVGGSLGNYFILIAALTVPASVQFPIISGGIMVFTALAALVFYKEKPDFKGIICLISAFISTFLFMY